MTTDLTPQERIERECGEAEPPLDPSRAETEAAAERVKAAAAAGDPLAQQAMANAELAAAQHPEPTPVFVDHDCAENQRDIAEEIRTGRTVVKQRGHLEPIR